MTQIELLQKTIRELESICVPVGLTAQIGAPLFNAVGGLKTLCGAVMDAKKKQDEAARAAAREEPPLGGEEAENNGH